MALTRKVRFLTGSLVICGLGLTTAAVVSPLSAAREMHPRRPVSPAVHLPAVDHVVIVGVAGLRWADVSWPDTPHLIDMVQQGSVGTMSVRSARSVTCPDEGWVTLGAGTYAATHDPGDVAARDDCDARSLPPARTIAGRARIVQPVEVNRSLRFGAQPGWLADQLGCVAAVGQGGALGAADSHGTVLQYRSMVDRGFSDFARRCPATIVDLGSVPEGSGRAAALERFDTTLGQIQQNLPTKRTVLMVLGVAESQPTVPRLHVAASAGPGFGRGLLGSSSTQRLPFIQLVDVAPTVLQTLGREFDDDVAGRPFFGQNPGRPDTLAQTIDQLRDTDIRAVQQRKVLGRFFVICGALVVVLSGVLTCLVRAGRKCRPNSSSPLPALQAMAVGLSSIPIATFLANATPWWRTDWPLPALWLVVLLWATVILGVAIAGAMLLGGDGADGQDQLVCVAAVSVYVLLLDAATGSSLQIDSMLGYNPVVAGRFTGFGNIAFSVLGAAAVILVTFLAYGRARLAAFGIVASIAAPVIAIDVVPQWGADFGGGLALVPTFVVLALLVTGAPVTGRRLLLSGVAGLVLVGVISWLDYRRPEDARSHFGRFIGSLLEGDVLSILHRKALTSWELLLIGPHTVAALVLTAALVVCVFRPPPLLRTAYETHRPLRSMLHAMVTLAGFGFALNDSGVAIPAVIALVVGPATIAMCASKSPATLRPSVLAETGRSDR